MDTMVVSWPITKNTCLPISLDTWDSQVFFRRIRPEPCTYSVYDLAYGILPATSTVLYTLHIHMCVWFWSTLCQNFYRFQTILHRLLSLLDYGLQAEEVVGAQADKVNAWILSEIRVLETIIALARASIAGCVVSHVRILMSLKGMFTALPSAS
jgi:hypothetical protein